MVVFVAVKHSLTLFVKGLSKRNLKAKWGRFAAQSSGIFDRQKQTDDRKVKE